MFNPCQSLAQDVARELGIPWPPRRQLDRLAADLEATPANPSPRIISDEEHAAMDDIHQCETDA